MGSLTIAAYVFGYGLGAMFFSPISEIPSLGRNIPYVTSFALFLVFSVLAATAKSFTGLVVARLFQGLMGSPALATGGASMQDLFELQYVPFAFTGWMGAACLGPALGPTISAFSVQAENWRWSLWEVAWLAGPVFVLMFTLLPETSRAKILFDRRKRLCIPNIGTASQPTMYARFVETLTSTLYRPTKILLTQPAIAFSNVYTCLIYGVYYTFFDSVPRVYLQVYHFEVSEVGLSFLSISAGTVLGIAVFLPWAYRWMRTAETKSPRSDPERCLVPALYASISVPISLLIFVKDVSLSSLNTRVDVEGFFGQMRDLQVRNDCVLLTLARLMGTDKASMAENMNIAGRHEPGFKKGHHPPVTEGEIVELLNRTNRVFRWTTSPYDNAQSIPRSLSHQPSDPTPGLHWQESLMHAFAAETSNATRLGVAFERPGAQVGHAVVYELVSPRLGVKASEQQRRTVADRGDERRPRWRYVDYQADPAGKDVTEDVGQWFPKVIFAVEGPKFARTAVVTSDDLKTLRKADNVARSQKERKDRRAADLAQRRGGYSVSSESDQDKMDVDEPDVV
ncbi:hypothetical protein MBLNU459_g8331t1 [Dothideomycetes sp. NU459]